MFLFLIQNICCGYSKESSQLDDSFEHPKHMIKLMGRKIFTSLRLKIVFILTYAYRTPDKTGADEEDIPSRDNLHAGFCWQGSS